VEEEEEEEVAGGRDRPPTPTPAPLSFSGFFLSPPSPTPRLPSVPWVTLRRPPARRAAVMHFLSWTEG
jgi:hypothetical protein